MMAYDRLARYVIEIGGDASDLDKVFAGIKTSVSSTVADLQRTTSKIDLFADLKNSIPGVERSLQTAKDAVTRFAAEIAKIEASGGKAPKELTKSLADAEKAVVSTTRELGKQQQKLTELDTALTRSGVNTRNLAAEQERLATASKAAADAAALQASKQALGLTTLKDIAPEIARLRQAYEALRTSGTLSAKEIAAAEQQLQAKIKELQGTVTTAAPAFAAMGGEAKSALLGIAGPALAAVGGIAGVTTALTSASEAAKAFANEVAKFGAVTNLSKSQLDTLSQGAKELARDLGIDVFKAMEGVRDIVRSGIPADNALEVLRLSAEASKAALTDLSVGIKAAGNLVDAFGLPLNQLGRAFDILNVAAKAGGFTLQEFAEGSGNLLQIARSAGIGLEQLTAALTVITSSGVDASSAMNDLSKVIISLGESKVRGKLQELGIEATDLVTVFQQLSAKGLNVNDFLELDIASAKSAKSIAALVENAAKLPTVLRDAATASGAVQVATEQLFATPAERAARFDAAVQSAKINLGESLGITGRVTEATTLLLNAYNAGAEAIKKQNDAVAAGDQVFIHWITTLGDFGQATDATKEKIRDFHEELAVQSVATATAVATVSDAVKKLKEFGPELAKFGGALTESTTAAIGALNEQAQRQIDLLDKTLKKQVETAAKSAELEKTNSAARVKLIEDNEVKVTKAIEAAMIARAALGEREKENANVTASAVAKIRIDALKPILEQYKAHYETLKGTAAKFQADMNAIEQSGVAFNQGIQDSIRNIRLQGLSDLQQYAERQQEVDRLIAKGRETASTQGIQAAQQYFDKAKALSESVKGEVLSDGTVVVSAFEAQQKSLELLKRVGAAYTDELSKAGEKAKAGGDQTRAEMDKTAEKIKQLQDQVLALTKVTDAGINLKINKDIAGLEAAELVLEKLTRDRTVKIGVAPGQEGSPEFVGPPSPGFNRGGEVRQQFAQMYAGGGPVFRPLSGHRVPGVGSGDTHPAALPVGAFVIRKAAAQFYGDSGMARLARGYASGGPVEEATQAELAIAYHDHIVKYLQLFPIFREAISFMRKRVELIMRNPGDSGSVEALIKDVGTLASNIGLVRMAGFTGVGASGKTLEKALISFPDFVRGLKSQPSKSSAFRVEFATGGPVGSDRVPAWLTPGETILNPSVTRLFGSNFLNAVNQMRVSPAMLSSVLGNFRPPSPRYFNNGGIVPGMSVPERGTLTSATGANYTFVFNGANNDFTDPRVQRRAANGIREQLRREGILSS
jgi:TP901 family phage tail tape measure protein